MTWVFAVIGLVVGTIVGLLSDFSASAGALVGAAAGFVVGRVLQSVTRALSGKEPSSQGSVSPGSAPPATLSERVTSLETEVEGLRRELVQLRGQLAGVSAGASGDRGTSPVLYPQCSVDPSGMSSADADAPTGTPLDNIPPQPVATQPLPVEQPASAYAIRPTPAAAQATASVPADADAAAWVDDTAIIREPAIAIEPPQPPAPRGPGLLERAFRAARDWLFGGNTVVRVGMIVLFFGVAFLLKYAADNNMLPVEFRLAGVALGATALLAAGWRIGDRRGAYGLVLQGGGVGVLYLTVFAATKLYHLLPSAAALPLMVVICALSAFLAVRQNASPLAFMGSAGGFLAPILLASGGGSHVALFSYYALLNAGIFAIAWFKAWRPLNLLGFVFTFSIGTAWGVTAYRPELLWSTEPFLVLFFLMYVGIALLYGVRREITLKHYVDGTLVFGTPIVAIGLQAALMKHMEFGLAWSAVALAAFYLVVATWLSRRRDRLGLLFESMLALAVIFATLAVPLAFSGPTTSAAWAIEGAAIVWVSVRERRLVPFAFGLLMQIAAGCAFGVGQVFHPDLDALPVLNSNYIATLLVALGGVFTGWWLHGRSEARAWHAWMPDVGLAAAAWGLLWWLGGGTAEILAYADRYTEPDTTRFVLHAITLFAGATAWLAHIARRRLSWALAEWPALALVPALALLVLAAFEGYEAPFRGMGVIVWLVSVASAYLLLWRQERDVSDQRMAPLHTLMFWNLSGLLALEGYWRIAAYVPEGAWRWSAWAFGFGALLLLIAGVGERLRWPVARFPRAYQVWGAAPLAALLWVWSIASVSSDGDASPLFWLPLLNPLDVAQLLAFMAIVVWLRRLRTLGVQWRPHVFDYAALATVFLWFNALLLRTLHHRFHTAYDVYAVLSSFGRQQVFLVGWSAFAFVGMWLPRRDGLVRLFAIASTPLILVMWIWTFYANLTQDGGSWARVPLLNPLDLVQVAIYAIAVLWLVRVSRLGVPVANYRVPLQAVAVATGFLWLNAMLLRTLNHWAGIPYSFDDMTHSMLVQASVSVFWTLCALPTMIWATHRANRALWFVGGALLALTVVKLFVFDLSHVQGIERIVSFIGIGVLLLLIGYFSPLPPKARTITEASS